MPANSFNGYTDDGIGIGLRLPHYRHVLEKKPVVDWFETVSENLMVDGGRPDIPHHQAGPDSHCRPLEVRPSRS